MSYIGRGLDAISNVEKLDNITFDGSATYALTKSSAAFTPVGANNLLVSIDGVVQMGNFSVSTTNISFDWSPTSSNTNNFILHYGTGVLNVPADGSIVAAKMAANSVDSDAYVDGSIDTAHIDALQVTGAKLNTDVISAQTALAAEPADTDEFMVSDGGVLKRIDYSLIKGTGSSFKTYSGTFDPQTTGDISISSIGFTPLASMVWYSPLSSAVTDAEGNWSFGFAYKVDATTSGYGHMYNYFQQNAVNGVDANEGASYAGRLSYGGGKFSMLTITAWDSDALTLTRTNAGTPNSTTVKYQLLVMG